MPPIRNQSIPMSRRRNPYSTRKELEFHSPSRRDGITFVEETNLRSLYCSHIKKAGQSLKLSPFTIATALMLCHRFYSRQSHAKNCWRTMASSCVLLASKVQDEPRFVKDVVHVVYESEIQNAITDMMKRKKLNPNDKREREGFSKTIGEIMKREKKELILKAEMLVLKTIGLNLNPYEALAAALNMFKSDKIIELSHLTWNLIEEWLIKTSLCLQYEPQYITVGSVVVAARILHLKPPPGEKWLENEFDVSPEKLDEVIQQMQSNICKLQTKETIRIVSFYEIFTPL